MKKILFWGLELFGALLIIYSASTALMIAYALSRGYAWYPWILARAFGELFTWLMLLCAFGGEPWKWLPPVWGYLVSAVFSAGFMASGIYRFDYSSAISDSERGLMNCRELFGCSTGFFRMVTYGLCIGLLLSVTGDRISSLIHHIIGLSLPIHPALKSAAPVSVLFITIGLVVPIVEELIFRGFFMRAIKVYSNPLTAVVLSSILFAMVHQPAAMPGAFICGVILAFTAVKHGLMVSMISHSVNNLIVLLYS